MPMLTIRPSKSPLTHQKALSSGIWEGPLTAFSRYEGMERGSEGGGSACMSMKPFP